VAYRSDIHLSSYAERLVHFLRQDMNALIAGGVSNYT
jgi:hypothetical protein